MSSPDDLDREFGGHGTQAQGGDNPGVFDDTRLTMIDHATFRYEAGCLQHTFQEFGIDAHSELCQNITAVAHRCKSTFDMMGYIRRGWGFSFWSPVEVARLLCDPERPFKLDKPIAAAIADKTLYLIDPSRATLARLQECIKMDPSLGQTEIIQLAKEIRSLRQLAKKIAKKGIISVNDLAQKGYHLDLHDARLVVGRLFVAIEKSTIRT